MIELRPYQQRFVDDLRAAFRQHRSVLGMAPTGAGKTVTSAYIAQAAAAIGKRVLFTVHRDLLLHQTAETFDQFGIPYGFVKSGLIYDSRPLVHIASIDTLRNRLDAIQKPDLMVIDEAHLARANTWHKCAAYFRERGSRLLGNSGSPQRLDGKGLGDLFDALVCGPSVAELIAGGHLSTYRYFAPSSPDMDGVRKKMGDFDRKATEAAADTASLIGDIVGHWLRIAKGKRTVCFTVSHAHSDHLIAEFRARGVTAESISSKTPSGERKRLITAFADGAISVLCNVELITTGFDLAAQVGRDVTVEAVILARPTQSLALYLQMVGRALRKKSEPAIILDHAGNSLRHGFPDDDREWSLDGEGKGAKKLRPPPLDCQVCMCQVRPPPPATCPHCGSPWPEFDRDAAGGRSFDVDETAALEEISEDERKAQQMAARRARISEEGQCRTLADFQALAEKRGYKIGWATHRYEARQKKQAEQSARHGDDRW